MASWKTFKVGASFSDKQRKHPPKVRSIITYRFETLTNDGVPRLPSYIGKAVGRDEPKDAEVPGGKRVLDG
jgi:DNA ligase-1